MTTLTPSELLAKAKEALAKAEAAKQEKAKAKELEKAKAKELAKAEKIAAKGTVTAVSQNGVVAPKEGTMCAKVWQMAKDMSTELGKEVPINLLVAVSTDLGLNANTVRTQFSQWRRYHGLTQPRVKTTETV